MSALPAWRRLVALAQGVFTRPGFALFEEIVTAWVLCVGRPTTTNLVRILGPGARRAHDAYHRWFRAARWDPLGLWAATLAGLVGTFAPTGDLTLLADDTHLPKTGPKVEGAGKFRDPIRSTRRHVVYLHGLNIVVLCLRLRLPALRQPVAVPINVRVYRKGGPSHLDLLADMARQVIDWLPDRQFLLIADGAYAPLAKRDLPRTHVISRLRRDAALYDLPAPRRKGQRGRPRKRGERLPCPRDMARQITSWQRVTVHVRDRVVDRWLATRVVLWYGVLAARPVQLVIVRDPSGKQPDDFFFTTDLTATAESVVSNYADRWSIEVTFRDAKQVLGAAQPQAWKFLGPERVAHLAFWLHGAIWTWYLTCHGDQPVWHRDPWYKHKTSPSFADALTALRTVLWNERLFLGSLSRRLEPEITDTLIQALARAG